jgi:hypothetical protein
MSYPTPSDPWNIDQYHCAQRDGRGSEISAIANARQKMSCDVGIGSSRSCRIPISFSRRSLAASALSASAFSPSQSAFDRVA